MIIKLTHEAAMATEDPVVTSFESPLAFSEKPLGSCGESLGSCDESFDSRRFFVVGIGASVDSSEALHTFLGGMDLFHGLACVLVLHGVASEDEVLADLAAHTALRVLRVTDGMSLHPGHLYLVPLQTLVRLENNCFHILPEPASRYSMPVDTCLASLAEELKERCMAVLLAGTGVDGVKGVKAVKEQGGFTMAQDVESAYSAGLVSTKILLDMCDLVRPPELLAAEVPRYLHEPAAFKQGMDHAFQNETLIGQIYYELKNISKIDFTYYKLATVQRRIRRRIALCQISSLQEYLDYLRENAEEVHELTKDILIGVTSFFRDPECFEALREKAVLPLLTKNSSEDALRVWVAGCSTGEEAYSVAILFDECQQELGTKREIKIFATDVDTEAVKFASRGIYNESIQHDVTPERLEKYFSHRGSQYHVNKSIRQKCIFSPHNLFVNPPFGQLHLITYRNVLIYFQPILQKTIFATFHNVLKAEGYLFLGKNEFISEQMDAFLPVSPREKIFIHNIQGRVPGATLSRTKHTPSLIQVDRGANKDTESCENDGFEVALPQILDTLAKACAVVTDEDEVEYLSGAFEPFIRLSLGAASKKLSTLLIPELALAVSNVLRKARQQLCVVTSTGIALPDGSLCCVTAMPLRNRRNKPMGHTAVLFSPEDPVHVHGAVVEHYVPEGAALLRIEELESELRKLKGDLQYNISELQTVNEELQTTNEEMRTANEELQTSNEELQSVNEEVYTVNAEHQQKLEEVLELNDDMTNFLNSTLIGIMFVDVALNIRKVTEYVTREFAVHESDIGRSLSYFLNNFEDDGLVDDVYRVGITLTPLQREVRTSNGKCYMLRVSPYRTVTDTIKGLVLSVTDIEELKGAYTQIEKLSYALEQIPIGVTLTDLTGHVEYVNSHFTIISGHTAKETLGRELVEIFPDDFTEEEKNDLRTALQEKRIWRKEAQCSRKDGEQYWERMTLMPVINHNGIVTNYLKLAEDITSHKVAQLSENQYRQHLEDMVQVRTVALEGSRNEAQAASRAKTVFLSTVSHEIRTPMNAIVGFAHIFDRSNLTTKQKDQLDKIRLSASTLLAVINDVLDISKIEAGKLELQCEAFSLRKTLETVRSIVAVSAEAKNLELLVEVEDDVPDWVNGDVLRLNQVMLNLLNNAIKFTHSGHVRLRVEQVWPAVSEAIVELQFTVSDTGIGIPEEQISRLFQAFSQADNTITRKYGGTGLGLAISRQLVELMGGRIHVESASGVGSAFQFTVCLSQASEDENNPNSLSYSETADCPDEDLLAGFSVLVVEDNLINQEIACALLEEHGMVTSRADNGRIALEMAAERRYGCILMDMQMPEMDGLEATKRLRAMGQTSTNRWLATVPIIAMTANAMSEDRARCLEAGMDDHIAKPIDPALLGRVLHHWLVS